MLKFDLNIIFTFINILVLFIFLKLFLFKPVLGIIEKRMKIIRDSLQDADDKKAEAYKIKSEYEQELKLAGEKASLLIKDARERAEAEYNRILQEAQAEAAKIMEESRKIIELERVKSMESAKADIAGIAMLVAAKVIGKNADENTNKQLIGEFIKEAGAAQ